MDMMSQLVGQVLNGFAKVPAMPQTKKGESVDFDSMIRNKYQETNGQKTQEQPESGNKTETGSSESSNVSDASETEQPKEQITDSAEAESQPVKVEDMKQQYELVAALMAQAQPVTYDDVQNVQPQTVTEEVHPQVVEAVAGEIETVIPVQEQQVVADQQIPEAVAETAGADVAEQKVVETVEAKPVEAKAEVEAPKEAAIEQVQEKPHAEHQEQAGQQEMASDMNEGDAGKTVEVVKTQEKPTEDTEVETEEAPVEAPVFKHVEATPIKVAEAPEKPVNVQADDAPQQIADELEIPLQEGESRAVISLTPENLGHVTVEITRAADGSLSVVLSASTPKAASLLEHHSTGLQQLLAANNDADVRIEVRGGQENQPQYMDPNGRNGQQQSQQQHQQQQQHQEEHQVQDFIQQLRLGLLSFEEDVS